jgi:hypothetical protein
VAFQCSTVCTFNFIKKLRLKKTMVSFQIIIISAFLILSNIFVDARKKANHLFRVGDTCNSKTAQKGRRLRSVGVMSCGSRRLVCAQDTSTCQKISSFFCTPDVNCSQGSICDPRKEKICKSDGADILFCHHGKKSLYGICKK